MFTSAMFAEPESRLWKPKFDRNFNMNEHRSMSHVISAAAIWVDAHQDFVDARYCCDADDNKFVHATVAVKEALFITCYQDFLVPARSLGNSYFALLCKPVLASTVL